MDGEFFPPFPRDLPNWWQNWEYVGLDHQYPVRNDLREGTILSIFGVYRCEASSTDIV